jgi:hypothetical protein
MRAMVVEVGPEIEQLVFEICRRPEQNVIQILLSMANCYFAHDSSGFHLDVTMLYFDLWKTRPPKIAAIQGDILESRTTPAKIVPLRVLAAS